MPDNKPLFVGISWNSAIGWYAWFGHSPYTVRVPLKTAAKPLKAAGKTIAAHPSIYISGVLIVGLIRGLVNERQGRKGAEAAYAYQSAQVNLAEDDRDLARSQAEAMERELKRGHEMTLDISKDQISEIREQLGINSYDRNIAVCGRVSTGKSAFVNAVRGLLSTSADAAPIGNEETTSEIQPYRDPHLPTVVWWDIPGAGGQNSREWNYCSQQCLFAFDQVIIVHDQVFSQTECNIYRSCIEIGKDVLIVRTQSDNNMSRVRTGNQNLEGVFLVNRYVSESIRATEDFLNNAHLPKPPALYHVTADLLTRTRDRSHIILAHPLLQDIDELRLLIELGIPRIEESDEAFGDNIEDEFEDPAVFSDGGSGDD